jgi:hypothetical protein
MKCDVISLISKPGLPINYQHQCQKDQFSSSSST